MAQEESDICLVLFVFANQLDEYFQDNFCAWPRLKGGLQAATFAPAPETQVEEQAVSPEPSAPVRHFFGMSFLELYRGASILRPSLLQRAGHIYCKTSAMSRQHGNTIHFQG